MYSNVEAIVNIGKVNKTAVNISDEQLTNISELTDIQKDMQALRNSALSHIIATDLDTMIALVDMVREHESTLEGYLDEYSKEMHSVLGDYVGFSGYGEQYGSQHFTQTMTVAVFE